MSVKLTNFVKIAINNHLKININGTRDTAVLFHYKNAADNTTIYRELSAMPDVTAADYDHLAGIKDYLESFFNNGGKNLYVISYINTVAYSQQIFNTELEKLPANYILVGFVNDSTNGIPLTEDFNREKAAGWNSAKSNEKIYQKIFVNEIPYINGTNDLDGYEDTSHEKVVSIENYVLKYGAQGVGASILAYFTKIDVYSNNAAQDYAFTTEVYNELASSHLVFNDNTIIEKIIKLDLNADTKLAGKVKNVGGNDTAGYDVTNQFMLLVLHQILTESLVQVLASKIKYNDTGLNLVLNTIVKELNRFVTNGYLSTNKAWTDGDLYYEGYKVIDNNTILNKGYKVMILPFSSLTSAEKTAHQLPKIYILLADSYSIRKVVIEGEVF